MTEPLYTYSESVEIISKQSEMAELLDWSYLDRDVLAAAKRFSLSEEFEEVHKLLSPWASAGAALLDVGAGNGIASFSFKRNGFTVTSLEPSLCKRTGIGAIALSCGPNSMVVSGFAEALPFSNHSFDIIYARQSLHHFHNLKQGLRECHRCLKPAGIFLACREHVVSDAVEKELFLNGHPLHALHGGENAYTLEEYKSALLESGLQPLKVLGPFDSVINHYPISNSQIRDWIKVGLHKRFGQTAAKLLGDILLRVSPLEHFYRSKLTSTDKTPGRLFTFLCRKQT